MFGITKEVAKAKAQLWIGYFLIALVVVCAGLALYHYIVTVQQQVQLATLQGEVNTATTRVEQVEQVNKQQAEALATVRRISEVNDRVLKGISSDMENLRLRDQSTKQRLAVLEKSNEAVRKYLDTVVPAAVGCVLDKTCEADGTGSDPAGAPAGSSPDVPGPRPGTKPD